MTPRRKISNSASIHRFAHCHRCLDELPPDHSPAEWARLNVGFTEIGLQVWCVRHELNVLHIDFQGARHPVNDSAPLPPTRDGRPTSFACAGCGQEVRLRPEALGLFPVDRAGIVAWCKACEEDERRDAGEVQLSGLAPAPNALFALGEPIHFTPGTAPLYQADTARMIALLHRHQTGDFGAVGRYEEIAPTVTTEEHAGGMFATDDAGKQNVIFIDRGKGSVQSEYELDGTRLWVHTVIGADTTVMLPEEY